MTLTLARKQNFWVVPWTDGFEAGEPFEISLNAGEELDPVEILTVCHNPANIHLIFEDGERIVNVPKALFVEYGESSQTGPTA